MWAFAKLFLCDFSSHSQLFLYEKKRRRKKKNNEIKMELFLCFAPFIVGVVVIATKYIYKILLHFYAWWSVLGAFIGHFLLLLLFCLVGYKIDMIIYLLIAFVWYLECEWNWQNEQQSMNWNTQKKDDERNEN